MNTPSEPLFELGRVRKIHGLHGSLVLSVFKFALPTLEKIETIYMELGSSRVPFFIEEISSLKEDFLVTLRGVNDAEKAKHLVGAKLFADQDLLSVKDPHSFYPFEIIGFMAKDVHFGELGPVLKVEESPGQDLLVILKDSKEVLVPIVSHFITSVDRDSKVILLDLPEGLIDLYLNDTP